MNLAICLFQVVLVKRDLAKPILLHTSSKFIFSAKFCRVSTLEAPHKPHDLQLYPLKFSLSQVLFLHRNQTQFCFRIIRAAESHLLTQKCEREEIDLQTLLRPQRADRRVRVCSCSSVNVEVARWYTLH